MSGNIAEHQKLYIRKEDGTVEHRYSVPDAERWGDAVRFAVENKFDLKGLTLNPQTQPLSVYKDELCYALDKEYLPPAQMPLAWLPGMNFSNIVLKGNFSHSNFRNCYSTGIAKLSDATMHHCDFSGAELVLYGTGMLKHTKWFGASVGLGGGIDYSGAVFVDANIDLRSLSYNPDKAGHTPVHYIYSRIVVPSNLYSVGVDISDGHHIMQGCLVSGIGFSQRYREVLHVSMSSFDLSLCDNQEVLDYFKEKEAPASWPSRTQGDGQFHFNPELLTLEDNGRVDMFLQDVTFGEVMTFQTDGNPVIYRRAYSDIDYAPLSELPEFQSIEIKSEKLATKMRALSRAPGGAWQRALQAVGFLNNAENDEVKEEVKPARALKPMKKVEIKPDAIANEALQLSEGDSVGILKAGNNMQQGFREASINIAERSITSYRIEQDALRLFAGLKTTLDTQGARGLLRLFSQKAANYEAMQGQLQQIAAALDRELGNALDSSRQAEGYENNMLQYNIGFSLYQEALKDALGGFETDSSRSLLQTRIESLSFSGALARQFAGVAHDMKAAEIKAAQLYQKLSSETLPLIALHISAAAAIEKARSLEELGQVADEMNISLAKHIGHDLKTLRQEKMQYLGHVKRELETIITGAVTEQMQVSAERDRASAGLKHLSAPKGV